MKILLRGLVFVSFLRPAVELSAHSDSKTEGLESENLEIARLQEWARPYLSGGFSGSIKIAAEQSAELTRLLEEKTTLLVYALEPKWFIKFDESGESLFDVLCRLGADCRFAHRTALQNRLLDLLSPQSIEDYRLSDLERAHLMRSVVEHRILAISQMLVLIEREISADEFSPNYQHELFKAVDQLRSRLESRAARRVNMELFHIAISHSRFCQTLMAGLFFSSKRNQ